MDPIELLLFGGLAYLVWTMIQPSIVPQSVTDAAGGLVGKTYSAAVTAFAHAFAVAEGFYVPGSIPARANNPGDLMAGDVPAGVPTNGTLGAGIVVFANLDDGWNALYHKLDRIFSGQSSTYNPNMTIAQLASHYTATEQQAWAHNVAATLGVTPDTTLADAAAQQG